MNLVGYWRPKALFLRISALLLVYVYIAEDLLVEAGRGGGGRGGSSGSGGGSSGGSRGGGSSGRGFGGSRKRYKGSGFDFGDDDYDYYDGDSGVDRKFDSSFIINFFRK